MRAIGVLQPVLVQPAEDEGEFELVDGERRYRAAFKVGLTEIPALVREREVDTGGLIGALTANFHRAAHTPVEEAHAFARLLEAGLTRKGVSERLQVSRELVRERLEILELPEELHAQVRRRHDPAGRRAHARRPGQDAPGAARVRGAAGGERAGASRGGGGCRGRT